MKKKGSNRENICHQLRPPALPSVGGVISLGVYTVLLLKLYSYQDTNRWCRQIRQEKAKKLRRSYSCKCAKRQRLGAEAVLGLLGSKYAVGAESPVEIWVSRSCHGPNVCLVFGKKDLRSNFIPPCCLYSHLVVARRTAALD